MSLDFYIGMLSDHRRIDGFRRGLASAVEPGDNVLEVGTGLGTYAFFAVEAGAALVDIGVGAVDHVLRQQVGQNREAVAVDVGEAAVPLGVGEAVLVAAGPGGVFCRCGVGGHGISPRVICDYRLDAAMRTQHMRFGPRASVVSDK